MSVTWTSWAEALETARREGRPVLLLLEARWSRFGAMLEATTFGDPAVVDALAGRVMAVKADVHDQPELAELYGQGGWPSVVVLDARNGAAAPEVLGGGTFLEAAQVRALVDHAVEVCGGRADVGAFSLPDSVADGPLDDTVLPAVEQALLSGFDERYGGFGEGAKFPHPEALDFAILRLSGTDTPRLRAVVEKTLGRMHESALRDRASGLFFRWCARRDWTHPETEQLLETNVALARNYLEAGQVLGRADFLAVGEAVVDAVLREFFESERGLFRQGFAPDDEYYELSDAQRATRAPPAALPRFLADGNARAISALLKAGAVLRRPDVTATALAVARQLVVRLWRPGHGMQHEDARDGRRSSGLLRDQVESARALQHVLQYTDDRRFGAPLDDLLDRIANEHVTATGEFANADRALSGDPPRRKDAAILESAAAAEVLLRGSMLTGRAVFADLARRALELHAGDFRRHGWAMAAYGRAVELLLHPPLHIVVVGSSRDVATTELFEAASSTYLPSRVVQHLDPGEDVDVLARLGLPRDAPATCYVFLAREGAAAHTDPATLPEVLQAANARRLV